MLLIGIKMDHEIFTHLAFFFSKSISGIGKIRVIEIYFFASDPGLVVWSINKYTYKYLEQKNCFEIMDKKYTSIFTFSYLVWFNSKCRNFVAEYFVYFAMAQKKVFMANYDLAVIFYAVIHK